MATADEITQLAASLAKLAERIAHREHEPAPEARPMPERILLTVEEAAERLGIGRTLAFRLIRSGEIATVQIGRLRRVPATAIQEYASRLVNQQQAA
ncbi:excisionase family DNA-binding protein [Amycolatopsis magusensis]|uniref:excisionase family DNA-binding protein n=1 Tax=Amycolatopsis magusensis TaxID=882444 RepID=UPI00378F72D5